jgi:hypothetical protein
MATCCHHGAERAFRLDFDKSVKSSFLRLMINIQGCHQTINIVAGDKVTFLLKKWPDDFGGNGTQTL